MHSDENEKTKAILVVAWEATKCDSVATPDSRWEENP
jgi:hypothetical protein